jgi:hypothetical protein
MSEAAPGKKMLGCHSSDPELSKESFVHQLSAFHSGTPILATNGGARSITSFSDSKSSAVSPPNTTRPTPSSPLLSISLLPCSHSDECLQTLVLQTASFSWRSEPSREPEHGKGTHREQHEPRPNIGRDVGRPHRPARDEARQHRSGRRAGSRLIVGGIPAIGFPEERG